MSPTNQPTFAIQPPQTTFATLSFPDPTILLVTFSRPRALNALPRSAQWELHRVWDWFDREPTLRVGIVTGQGRAFSAGMDLKEWNSAVNSIVKDDDNRGADDRVINSLPPSGFGGLSRRKSRKPIIAAVNGLAHGGGCEMVVNCAMVFAAPGARFALPEAKRGVVASAGALPRLGKIVGRMRAMEMVLTGREVGAEEARGWGLVNRIADRDGDGSGEGGVVELAVKAALSVAECSPFEIAGCEQEGEVGLYARSLIPLVPCNRDLSLLARDIAFRS